MRPTAGDGGECWWVGRRRPGCGKDTVLFLSLAPMAKAGLLEHACTWQRLKLQWAPPGEGLHSHHFKTGGWGVNSGPAAAKSI